MKKTIFIFLLFFCNYSYAQINLVRNPSFEQYSSCPYEWDQVTNAKYWSGIDTSSGAFGTVLCLPDYYNICSSSIFTRLPDNSFFHHYPRTGNGLIGMQMFCDLVTVGGGHNLDYLQGRLYSHLLAGNSYCVTFYVVLADHTGYAVNHIGAYLDDGTIDTTTRCNYYQTEYSPQIVETSIIYDTTIWTKIQGSFVANGTERFITIGNFFDTGGTSHVHYILPSYDISYYLIDDVSVIATDAIANAGVDRATTTDATDSVQIGDTTGYLPCYWYANGVLIDSNTAGFKAHPSVTTHYVMELDVCGHITYDTATVYVWTTGMNNPSLAALHIYPNPAKDNLMIERALGCELRIYNVVGQLVTVSPCCDGEPCCRGSARLTMTTGLTMTTNKEIVDISSLSKGVYIVEVCEPETGMKISRRVVKE